LLNKKKIAAILYKFLRLAGKIVGFVVPMSPGLFLFWFWFFSDFPPEATAMRSPCVCHAKSVVNCVALKSTHGCKDADCRAANLHVGAHCAKGIVRSILTLTLMDVPRLLFVQRLFSLSGTDPSRAITRYTAVVRVIKRNKSDFAPQMAIN